MAEQTVTVGVGALEHRGRYRWRAAVLKWRFPDESKHEMALSRAVIDHLADYTVPHYGISTGFGALCLHLHPKEQRAAAEKSDSLARRCRTGKWSVRWCGRLLCCA